MDRKRTYSAFTLVEMLIVMGIVIILMAVGITAGRYAINRANDVAHRNAVDQIYQSLQAYYADEREFPEANNPEDLITLDTLLADYMDTGTFDGGTDATYWYFVEEDKKQSVLVCVSLGGHGDVSELGIYCNGNGFNDEELLGGAITDKEVPFEVDGAVNPVHTTIVGSAGSNWTRDGRAWADYGGAQ